MNDDRTRPAGILRHIFEIALRRQMEIDLDGYQRLVPALSRLELNVDFRTIESSLSGGLIKGQSDFLHDAAQKAFAGFPHGRIVDVLLAVIWIAKRQAIRV